ncbi:MAG: HEAT repeat domain-containing protein [Chloroflexota bacterium]|nr:HEAT repeat domain-containing protein [Chloroflexota bacterium]
MEFDFQNFGLGLVTGWVTAYAVYRARGLFQATAETVSQTATTVGNAAVRSADSRYVNDLVAKCETSHLAGAQVKLSDIIIEPRFIPAPEFARPVASDEYHDVFEVVPRVPDHPALMRHYNIDTLAISELANGDHALALLGEPGSGRTTALLAIALHSLGKLRFIPPVDRVQQRLDSEDAKLGEKERVVRVKERIMMEQRAKEQLALERGVKYDEKEDEAKAKLPLFNRLMPIYVHFADIRLGNEYGGQIDPAEPIVRAVQHTVKRVTASTIPRHVYRRLSEGQVLLLLDGFDDLPMSERPAALAWLDAFMKEYKGNFVVAAGPVTGFGGLTKIGFTPIYLRPWHQADTDSYITRFSGMWTAIGRRRRGVKPPEKEVIDRSRIGTRALNPFDLSLKLWTAYADDSEMPGFEGWMRAYLKRNLPDVKSPDAAINSMALMSALQLEEGFITGSRLQALKIGEDADIAPPVPGTEGAAVATDTPTSAAEPGKKGRGRRAQTEDDSETKTAQGRLLGALRNGGLLTRYRGDRYQFHPQLASFLASLTLKSPEAVAAKLDDPAWRDAVAYANLRVPMDAIVNARLETSGDLLQESLIEMGKWVAYAPSDALWRGELMKAYGTMLSAPNQFPVLRERALAALVDSRDGKNALFVLRRAVRNTDSEIRRLACIGMGALGDPEGLKDLRALVRDQVENVAVAATLAVGAVGANEAVDILENMFFEGTERQRQAVAETFAMMPERGYPILNDAMENSEMIMRRSAAMGLRRLRTTWSLIYIYRAYLEDDQWYVRSAAQQAFEEVQFGRAVVATQAYPKADSIDWLRQWVTSKGEKLPSGDLAAQMLVRALSEGDPPIRALAAMNIAQLGMTTALKNLYTALRDRQDDVRITAHRALALMQMQVGRSLPTVT